MIQAYTIVINLADATKKARKKLAESYMTATNGSDFRLFADGTLHLEYEDDAQAVNAARALNLSNGEGFAQTMFQYQLREEQARFDELMNIKKPSGHMLRHSEIELFMASPSSIYTRFLLQQRRDIEAGTLKAEVPRAKLEQYAYQCFEALRTQKIKCKTQLERFELFRAFYAETSAVGNGYRGAL